MNTLTLAQQIKKAYLEMTDGATEAIRAEAKVRHADLLAPLRAEWANVKR